MQKLDGAVVYLSGPMEYASDYGVNWRQEIIKSFKDNDLNIICLDPTNKPVELHGTNLKEDVETTKRLKNEGKWEELTKFVKEFRRKDLRYTDLSDFIIAVIDPNIHLCGTYNEIFEAERQKKPRFAIIKGGLKAMPSWLFAVFNYKCVFSSVDECVQHLKKINDGTIRADDKWVLIRNHLKGL